MAQPTYSFATGTVLKTKNVIVKDNVRTILSILGSDGAKTEHWVSPKFIENVLFGQDIKGLSGALVLRGASAYWEQASVKKGDVVLDDKGQVVMKEGKPQTYKEDQIRFRNLEVVISDEIIDKVLDKEITKRTEVKFSSADILAMFARPLPKAVVSDVPSEQQESAEELADRLLKEEEDKAAAALEKEQADALEADSKKTK
jgi:hypothetical protein